MNWFSRFAGIAGVVLGFGFSVFAMDLDGLYGRLKNQCDLYIFKAGAGAELPFAQGLRSVFEIDPAGYQFQWKNTPIDQTSSLYKRVERQAFEVSLFLRDLYQANPFSDVSVRPFRVVQIVPKNLFGERRAMELVGDVLIIRLGWRVMPAAELLSRWNRGLQFPGRSLDRRLWRYVNPAGTTMRLTRQGLQQGGALLKSGLRTILGSGDKPIDRDNLISFLRNALSFPEDQALPVEQDIRSLGDEELRTWVQELADTVASENQISNIVASAVAVSRQQDGGLDIQIVDSWMIYGNFHWIVVNAGLGGRTMRVTTTNEAATSGNAAQSTPAVRHARVSILGSIVGGYTVDIVDVRAFSDSLLLSYAIDTLAQRTNPNTRSSR